MKYTKKPVTIEAIKFNGTWSGLAAITGMFPDLVQDGMFLEEDKVTVPWFGISTLEGTMKCSSGDYVIKGIKGEFYPCKPDIFDASYSEFEVPHKGTLPKEVQKAMNALRLEVDGSIVNSISDIILSAYAKVEVTRFDGSIPLTMNGEPLGHWQMLSVRGNLLVHPIFMPIDGIAVAASKIDVSSTPGTGEMMDGDY